MADFYPLLLIFFQVQELKVIVVVSELVIKYPYIFILINKRVKKKSIQYSQHPVNNMEQITPTSISPTIMLIT